MDGPTFIIIIIIIEICNSQTLFVKKNPKVCKTGYHFVLHNWEKNIYFGQNIFYFTIEILHTMCPHNLF